MSAVPNHQWDNEEKILEALQPDDANVKPRIIPRRMHALAYYIAATCVKEQQHIPIIGPSLDRRMLSLLTHLCNSDTVQSLVCVSCAQVHVCVKSWTRLFPTTSETWRNHGDRFNAIEYQKVEYSLLQMMRSCPATFSTTFELSNFVERFANDVHVDGNPFASCEDFAEDRWEWKRKLRFSDGRICTILCCPEDVRHSKAL